MTITENLNLIRHNLQTAKGSSTQARRNFQNIESGSGQLGRELAALDTFQASLDTVASDCSAVGDQACLGLSRAGQRLQGLDGEQASQAAARKTIESSLGAALAQLGELGLPEKETAQLKMAMDTASLEERMCVLEHLQVETGLYSAKKLLPASAQAAATVKQDSLGLDSSQAGGHLHRQVDALETRLHASSSAASSAELRQGRVGGHLDVALTALWPGWRQPTRPATLTLAARTPRRWRCSPRRSTLRRSPGRLRRRPGRSRRQYPIYRCRSRYPAPPTSIPTSC